MAFGDEHRDEVTASDSKRAETRIANAEKWNKAARSLLAFKDVLDMQSELGVAILTPNAEVAVRLAFAGDPETVGYLENYPFGGPGHDEVSDRRTVATEGLLAGILEEVKSGADQHQLVDVPQA